MHVHGPIGKAGSKAHAGLLLGLGLLLLLPLGSALVGCSNPEQARARQAAAEAALAAEDDAQCRRGGAQPTGPAYDECRKHLAQLRSENGIDEQKRRAFDQVNGAGTSGGL
jgi:hypothetical protein